MEENLKNHLKIFGFTDFKSDEQYQGIVQVLKGEDDVLIHMPPGAGKSLCYQLPAVLSPEKCVIVFVPSISSSNDAVEFLKKHQVNVKQLGPDFLKSKKTKKEDDNLLTNKIKINILFVAVSLCEKQWLQEYINKRIKRNLVSFFVLDEAHCISEKTLEYNQHYEHVKLIRSAFPSVKLVALTSTITPHVKADVLSQLKMDDASVVEAPSAVPYYIYIDVNFMDLIKDPLVHMSQLITHLLKNEEDRAIIFCRKADQTFEVAKKLNQQGYPSAVYNSKLTLRRRNEAKTLWKSGKIKIIVATHDFVFGLDYQSVRCVINWTMPSTMSQYYRQISTAGRDKKLSVCRLYYSLQDDISFRLTRLKMSQTFYKESQLILDFCFSLKCRHMIYSKWLEDPIIADSCCGLCDNCAHSEDVKKMLSRFAEFKAEKQLVNLFKGQKTTTVYSNCADISKLKFLDAVGELPSPLRPCFNVFTVFGMNNTGKKIPIRWERTYNLHLLLQALYNNYRKCMMSGNENKNILRLGRILEYYAFITHRPKKTYHGEIHHLINSINKSSTLNEASNVITNYTRITAKIRNFRGSELAVDRIFGILEQSLAQHVCHYQKRIICHHYSPRHIYALKILYEKIRHKLRPYRRPVKKRNVFYKKEMKKKSK